MAVFVEKKKKSKGPRSAVVEVQEEPGVEHSPKVTASVPVLGKSSNVSIQLFTVLSLNIYLEDRANAR